jgi:hypothetical protein
MDIAARHAFPAGCTILLMLLTETPFGITDQATLLPAVTLACVYFWSLFRPAAMPPPVVFLIGLLFDLLGYRGLLGHSLDQRRGRERPVGFPEHVMPILAKAGCNAAACHASQYGKGGFKLSVFGFSPDDDHQAIVREGMGRRINPLDPGRSLILLKPTLGVPHEGGRRLDPASPDYALLRDWIAVGAPKAAGPAPTVTAIIAPSSAR